MIQGTKASDVIRFNKRIFKDDLYLDFVKENPDFSPRGKDTISRNAFYKWLNAYGLFKEGITISEGRSNQGRWIMFNEEGYEEPKEYEEEEFQF